MARVPRARRRSTSLRGRVFPSQPVAIWRALCAGWVVSTTSSGTHTATHPNHPPAVLTATGPHFEWTVS